MLRNILGGRDVSPLLNDACDEIAAMLRHSEHMFRSACAALLEGGEADAGLRREDREIHSEERLARRLLLEHLTINPDRDLPTSLAIFGIVHDAERLGDYAKHLVELGAWREHCRPDGRYAPMCRQLHEMIGPLFAKTATAVVDGNAELAREVMAAHADVKGHTDQVMEAVMGHAEVDRGTVVFLLASRYLRRISAHLSNIASGVANPLDQLGHNQPV
jgi:phosphate uptake regulator